jgi:hypothetical protein
MTTLLQKAVAEIEQLAAEDQDAIAARWLAEAEDERAWNSRFAKTTDEQWDKLAEKVRKDIQAGRVVPLDQILPD